MGLSFWRCCRSRRVASGVHVTLWSTFAVGLAAAIAACVLGFVVVKVTSGSDYVPVPCTASPWPCINWMASVPEPMTAYFAVQLSQLTSEWFCVRVRTPDQLAYNGQILACGLRSIDGFPIEARMVSPLEFAQFAIEVDAHRHGYIAAIIALAVVALVCTIVVVTSALWLACRTKIVRKYEESRRVTVPVILWSAVLVEQPETCAMSRLNRETMLIVVRAWRDAEAEDDSHLDVGTDDAQLQPMRRQ